MVSRGRLFDVLEQPGFIAEQDVEWLGCATYQADDDEVEVTILQSFARGRGVGSALIAACVEVARDRDARRVLLITTNDNRAALDFYRRRGWQMVATRTGAVTEARLNLKPEIPLLGENGIPIRDEIELELPRSEWERFVARYGW